MVLYRKYRPQKLADIVGQEHVVETLLASLVSGKISHGYLFAGPRGTGKTTWVKKSFPFALYIDLLKDDTYKELLARPSRLENIIPKKFSDWIIIDEVQRVPNLLNEVHRLIEEKHYRFVLTGSSARKLRAKGVNLLAGRALLCHFYPLTSVELGGHFDLKHALQFGFLPGVYNGQDPKQYLDSYVKAYLREEVLQEGLIRNIAAFAHFLEVASFSQGGMLNMSEIARECAIDRKAVAHYFSILEDLLIAYRLPVFTKKAKRRLVAHEKFYFFDTGVYRTLKPSGPLDSHEDAEGAALETVVLQQLMAINEYRQYGYKIYFWRTSNNQEVDFILYGQRGLIAIEVKRSSKIASKQLSGLKAFAKEYPMAKTFLFYGGEQRYSFDRIEVWPIIEGLKQIDKML